MGKFKASKPRYTIFGLEVKKKMIDMGIRGCELESHLDMPKNLVSKIITGDKKGYKYLPKIAKYLEIDLDKYIS